jgi:hypothetical protein
MVWTRAVDYGTLTFVEDGRVAATTWLTLWTPVKRDESKIVVDLETFFDGKPLPASSSTVVVTGRTAKIPIPLEIVNLAPGATHALTGRVTLTGSDSTGRIWRAELPLHATIQPRDAR